MKDKRELLELAARAAGYRTRWSDYAELPMLLDASGKDAKTWDPTADDGDCARLEAAVQLEFLWFTACIQVAHCEEENCVEFYTDHNNDRQAARRLASTRAASEVGRGMKP